MKIEVDYKVFDSSAKSIAEYIGGAGLGLQLNNLKKNLNEMEAAWEDEQNKSQIEALKAKIKNLESVKTDASKYMKIMQVANKTYKSVVDKNLALVKSL